MSKKTRTILGVVLLMLALGAGYFASIVWGLARMDTGIVTWTPQLAGLIALPVALLIAAFYCFSRHPKA